MAERPTPEYLKEACQPLDASASIEQRLTHLASQVELANHLQTIAERDTLDDGSALRLASGFALQSIIGFLDSFGMSAATLRRLGIALAELDSGHEPPIFSRPKLGHRGKDRATIASRKGMAAAALDLLHRGGEPLSEAKAVVAKALKKPGFTNTVGSKYQAGRSRVGVPAALDQQAPTMRRWCLVSVSAWSAPRCSKGTARA